MMKDGEHMMPIQLPIPKERLAEIHKLAAKSDKYIYHLRADEVEAMTRALLAAYEQEPVFFVEIEGDDWINAGRIEGKGRPDLGLLPDGINYLYAHPAPSVPAVPDEADPRDAFERAFPMPKHVIRCGDGYACTEYNAWDAHKFVDRWDGWNACRTSSSPLLGSHDCCGTEGGLT